MALGCLLAWVLAIGLLLPGCGASWQVVTSKTLRGAHEGLKGSSAVAAPYFKAECMAKAKACTVKPCQKALDCLAKLDLFTKVVVSARATIHLGLGAVAIGDEKAARAAAIKAGGYLIEAGNILTKAGVIK